MSERQNPAQFEAGELAAVLVGEGDQRVGQHGEQATGGEGGDTFSGDGAAVLGQEETESGRQAAGDHDQQPEPPETPHAQPAAARSADGAMASGTFDTNTAARKLALTGRPVASWTPKMSDSGTPSTTEPTTMPIAAPVALSGNAPTRALEGATEAPGRAPVAITAAQ